jgi:archaellum component FlaC
MHSQILFVALVASLANAAPTPKQSLANRQVHIDRPEVQALPYVYNAVKSDVNTVVAQTEDVADKAVDEVQYFCKRYLASRARPDFSEAFEKYAKQDVNKVVDQVENIGDKTVDEVQSLCGRQEPVDAFVGDIADTVLLDVSEDLNTVASEVEDLSGYIVKARQEPVDAFLEDTVNTVLTDVSEDANSVVAQVEDLSGYVVSGDILRTRQTLGGALEGALDGVADTLDGVADELKTIGVDLGGAN